jgi:hypothetical protein
VDAFGRFPLQRPDTGSEAQPLRMQMFLVAQDSNGVSALQSDARSVAYSQGNLVYLHAAGSIAVSDLREGFAFAIISPETALDLAFVRYSFIEALAQILIGGRGYVAIHAACVVKNGVSLMLCAPSGTGKSTLALACLQHGYQVLAEDVVQAHIMPDAVRLWGIPWRFRLLPDATRFFPQLGDRHPQLQANGEWKIEVDLESFFPGSTLTNAPAGLVVFLERDEQHPPCLHRLSLAEALCQFEAVWSWDLPWPSYYEEQLRRVLAQGAYRLCMRGVPEETVGLLDELVTEARMDPNFAEDHTGLQQVGPEPVAGVS